MEVKVICEDLNDYFHKVFLSDDVFTIDDLFEDGREDGSAIHVEVGPFELRESNQIGPDEDAEIFALDFTFITFAGMALVLKTDPELVHLDEIGEDEADRVLEISTGSVEVCHLKSSHLGRSQEETHPSLVPTGRKSLVCPDR